MAYEKTALESTILDVSEKLLFRYGYKNFNLNDVASEVGISKTTLYKTYSGKYQVASQVIERLLRNVEAAMDKLLGADLPLPEKLRQCADILSGIYTKMDREFLRDLENRLSKLWQKIDRARQDKERRLADLLAREQAKGVIRPDIDPGLLAALILALIIGMCNPTFFLSHKVSSDTVARLISDVILHGSLNPERRQNHKNH